MRNCLVARITVYPAARKAVSRLCQFLTLTGRCCVPILLSCTHGCASESCLSGVMTRFTLIRALNQPDNTLRDAVGKWMCEIITRRRLYHSHTCCLGPNLNFVSSRRPKTALRLCQSKVTSSLWHTLGRTWANLVLIVNFPHRCLSLTFRLR